MLTTQVRPIRGQRLRLTGREDRELSIESCLVDVEITDATERLREPAESGAEFAPLRAGQHRTKRFERGTRA